MVRAIAGGRPGDYRLRSNQMEVGMIYCGGIMHFGPIEVAKQIEEAVKLAYERAIPMLLICPQCGRRHIDEGNWRSQKHHTHACQFCGMVWRPAVVDTVGVQFLPGMKNASAG